uniref:RIPOR family member 3 n=1 Tax=Terrapene triunguis TaxID=2587831 RepID=A0A674I1U2_9SAUR
MDLIQSLSRNSVRSKMSVKSSKMYPSLQRGAVIWDPKPQQVKKIFEALKKGLNEYLQVHQAELDYLSARHKDTKRNSRLVRCFLNGVKQSPFFFFSFFFFSLLKVEELYETYCIQCRLRDGASNMKHAFSLTPSTKASRESLVELYKNLQEWVFLLVSGLVGYARLCPGDQYEVFVRLGRQKWKLKGKIETDDSQTWDEEEKVFIPNLHEKFEIKVTELRGLTTILVGVVTCDSIDFFTTRPQAIIVDITELGTIKLQLEVVWNPFDTENLFLSPGTSAKFSLGSRKSSLYNWTPPNTPSFREKYYLSVLQQRMNQGGINDEARAPCILSYLADCDFDVHLRNDNHSSAETDSFSSQDRKGTETRNVTPASDHRTLPLVLVQDTCAEGRQHKSPNHTTLDILKETPSMDGAPNSPSSPWDISKDGRDSIGQHWSHQPVEQENVLSVDRQSLNTEDDRKPAGSAKAVEKLLQEVLNLLKSQNPGQTQLEELEYQVLCIRDKLKLKTSHQKHSSMESLMVEMVLESFDFLNTDCSADELSLFGNQCIPLRATKELTTGNDDLDKLLIVHLQLCKALLQKLVSPNIARIVQESLLEEVSRQKQVLETASELCVLEVGSFTSVEEVIHKAKKQKQCLKIWSEFTEPGNILFCSAEKFQNPLKYILMFKVKEKYPGHLEAVLRRLLEQIVTCSGLLPSGSPPEELLTLFQFHSYLEKERVTNLEKHLAELLKEVTLIEELQRPGRLKKIKKLKGKRLRQLQPLPQTLRLLGILQLDDNRHVSKAATSCLSRAAMNKNFREKALLFYTDILAECDAKIQQAACLALKNLRAIESIEQIACLCQSETEDVRNAARETTLSFGEKGRLAFEKMDRVCCELRGTVYQEAEIEITIF